MDNKTILLVEDESKLRALLVDYMSLEGYAVIEAKNGREALEKLQNTRIDLILLDVMMPFLDGYEVCKTVRNQSNVIIILLTAKSQDEDKIKGYELGADDYVTKPFSPKVLMAKIKVLLQRFDNLRNHGIHPAGTLEFEGLIIRESSHEVLVDNQSISLSPKEYELLLFLVKNRNLTLTRDLILDRVWGIDYEGAVRTVDTHIMRLRYKLDSKANYIVTIKGYGYQFMTVSR